MWIFMNDSFLSIVAHQKQADSLLVRARHDGDIEAVFPKTKVVEGAGTDYQYRAAIPRTEVAQAIAARLESITYRNFKDSVTDRTRHHGYFGVWEVMRASGLRAKR